MAYKAYSNPLYEVVGADEWTNGLCCLFANALRERFELPMRAILVRSRQDGSQTLVHAFGSLPEGRAVDARGVRSEAEMMAGYDDYTESDWRELHGAYPGEEIDVIIDGVTLEELWDLNPEDHEATNAAHAYIEGRPELFGFIKQTSGH